MVFDTSYELCSQNVESDYLDIFAKCWKSIRFLAKYKAKYKSCKRLISSEKINVLVKMQPFPEVWLFFAKFGYFLKWVSLQFFLSGNPGLCRFTGITSSTTRSSNSFIQPFTSHLYRLPLRGASGSSVVD